MALDYFQVDAFSDRPFAGNPAIVYRLESWLPDAQMQRIANEHNLAETAFIVPQPGGWRIRWFTPSTEVPLCGHATLAAAHVLRTLGGVTDATLLFDSASGPLPVTHDEGRLWLDMAADPLQEEGVSLAVQRALGVDVVDVLSGSDLLVVLESEEAVRHCRPDMNALAQLGWPGVNITARGVHHDFVSRCFAPRLGIPEDPVTGSAHRALAPYWAGRLSKNNLHARQVSARGGEVWCRLQGERVMVGGHATLVAHGRLLMTLS